MLAIEDIQLLRLVEKSVSPAASTIIIEPLRPGYGTTIGVALRRVLLSSLGGAAITTVKINQAAHEFTTIEGVKEDVVDLILNLKGIRLRLTQDEPVTITLSETGPKTVTAADFTKVANVEIVNPDHYVATVDRKKSLTIEAVVEKGVGYLTTEKRKDQRLPIGMVAIDSIFTPIVRVNITTENTRVGQMTDYDRLILEVTTDGTIKPVEAVKTACQIVTDHMTKLSSLIDDLGPLKPARPKKPKLKVSR